MTNQLIILGVSMSAMITIILCVGMITIGKEIGKIPDGQELRGERVRNETDKKRWSSPEEMPKLFALGTLLIFMTGCMILSASDNSVVLRVIGGTTIFSAILFASGILAHELVIYNQMIANMTDKKMHMQAINE